MTTDELIKRVDEEIFMKTDGVAPDLSRVTAVQALRCLRTAVVALNRIDNAKASSFQQMIIEMGQAADEALDEIKKGWAE